MVSLRALKEYVPPIFWNWFRCRLSKIRVVGDWPATTNGGWAAAAKEAATRYDDGIRQIVDSAAIGYGSNEKLAVWSENDKLAHDRMVQLAFVVARIASGLNELRILDFGGGFGIHASAINRLLPGILFEYTVLELPEFCVIGHELNRNVRFAQSLTEAGGGYNLVYASSSIQYLRDWRDTIRNLCRASKSSMFITRTPFVFGTPTFVTVQRAYGTSYPGWIFNYHEFVHEASLHGMVLQEVLVNGRGIPIRGTGEQNVHLGLLFERANT